jgi:hypothetical protein
MQKKLPEHPQYQIDNMLRDFGVKPSPDMRDNLRLELEKQREQFRAIDRIPGKNRDHDISR